jgi:photosystem II stability/assembly factor-like uncharacterized protein
MTHRCRYAFASVLLLAATAHAQVPSEPYTWKSVKITAGGFITGIVFSPKEPGLILCRTDIGGAYRYDAKTRQWICLTDWVGPPNANLGGCESIALDPADPDKIYLALGTYSRGTAGVARSADRGKTFAFTTLPIAMGANENGRGMGERLAVDPSDPRILYFGSRRDGLWRSTNSAQTWERVASFTNTGSAGSGAGQPGIPWVIFDKRPDDQPGEPTRSILAGVASTTTLYRSTDAGETWNAIPGGPEPGFIPHRAALDPATHTLFISYGNGPGPNDVTRGSVMKCDIDAAKWTDITPSNPGNGGYGGIALDAQKPGTLMVSTIDHWNPADDIFRSADYGKTWKPIAATTDRLTAGTPYMANLLRGHPFDWWLAALAIDPFDSSHVMYGTGAGIWATREMTAFDSGKRTRWNIDADGIEETAVLALASPPWGDAHLISGVGDIGGFTHTDFTVSPKAAHDNPMFSNTTSIEFASLKPVVVRTGTPSRNGPTAAYSADGGMNWKPITLPGAAGAAGGRGGGYLTISADGQTLLTNSSGAVSISKDQGASWQGSTGLFSGARPFADRVAPATFYALDAQNALICKSTDGGATFTAQPASGLPPMSGRSTRGGGAAVSRVQASITKEGDLWALYSGRLLHSADAGRTFAAVQGGLDGQINNYALGKPAPGRDIPAIFASTAAGFFRSDDGGITWARINDDQHQFGGNLTVMTADPRIHGRLYLGMNGRGILYGDKQNP